MNPISFYEKTLITWFKDLPGGARVAVYFVVLALFTYLSLLPTFISGECFISYQNGGLRPLKYQFIHHNVNGQTIKVRINDEGIWSIPLVSKLPQDVKVYFLYDDTLYPVTFKATSLLLPGMQRVLFKENPSRFEVASINAGDIQRYITKKIDHVLTNVISVAYAQAKPKKKASFERKATIQDPFDESVRNAIATCLHVEAAQIKDHSVIKKELAMKTSDQIKLLDDLEQKFDVKIYDRDWDNVYTVKDLIEMIRQKKSNKNEIEYYKKD